MRHDPSAVREYHYAEGDPDEQRTTFADELRRWRLQMRLTQHEAADTLLVSRRTYEAWEGGHNTPSQATHFRKLMARELARRQNAN